MERYQVYFAGNALVLLAAIGVLWWSRQKKDRQKLLAYLAVIFLVAFNDIVYQTVIVRLGEMETYYRLLWILPVNVMAAYLVIEVIGLLKGWRRVALIGITAVFVLINAMPSITAWTTLPENIYQLDNEVIEIADMIDAHSGGKRVNVIDSDYTAIWHMREYNDNIYYWDVGEDELRQIIGREAKETMDTQNVYDAISAAQVDYIIVKKKFVNANHSLSNAKILQIGETDTYNVYWTGMRN